MAKQQTAYTKTRHIGALRSGYRIYLLSARKGHRPEHQRQRATRRPVAKPMCDDEVDGRDLPAVSAPAGM